jgi:hypothetical protein
MGNAECQVRNERCARSFRIPYSTASSHNHFSSRDLEF